MARTVRRMPRWAQKAIKGEGFSKASMNERIRKGADGVIRTEIITDIKDGRLDNWSLYAARGQNRSAYKAFTHRALRRHLDRDTKALVEEAFA